MTLYHFTVSHLRTATTCPRIHYFDFDNARKNNLVTPRSTLVWLPGNGAEVGGGALFHRIVEKFNRQAAHAPEIEQAMANAESAEQLKRAFLLFVNSRCIDLQLLSKRSVQLRKALTSTLQAYFSELADMVHYALTRGTDPSVVRDQIFGDRRQRVDVTFRVGDGDEAHVTGAIDYVFYDWRIGAHRIIDYKLLPPDHSNKDLFQVSAYALMHHHQHGTKPAASVFYLHPKRHVVERKWDQVQKEQHKVYSYLASMVGWLNYDEASGSGLKPRGNPIWCEGCRWSRNGQCEQRLGNKLQGAFDGRWEMLSQTSAPPLPVIQVREPTSPTREEDEAEEAELQTNLDQLDPPREANALATSQYTAPATSPATPPAASLPTLPPEPSTTRPTEETPPGVSPPSPEPTPTNEPVPPGLYLGRMCEGNAPVVLPVSVIKTHVAIVGAAGSGKTWAAKCLVEEAVNAGVPVIAIDPQGDLVQFLQGRSALEFEGRDGQRHAEYLAKVEPRIWTPGTSHGTRLCLDPIRLPSDADLARIEKADRRREERESMVQAAAANLVSLANVAGEEESQRTFLYLVLEALRQSPSLKLNDVVAAIGEADQLGLPHEPDQILKKAERDKLARKLNTFVLGPGKNLFSGGTPLDLANFVTPKQPGKTPLNVIYLNALTDDDQKHFFLAALASEIYRWMVTTLDSSGERPNLLFYIDEARDYIPAGGKKPAAKEPLIRLFTQGRKFGVGCLLCTQSPRSVDYNVFGNCSTKIVGRMEAEQDVERIADWFTTSGPRPPWVVRRKGADKGTFVARYPDMAASVEGREFKSRLLYSIHEGAWSPDRVEREVDQAVTRPACPGVQEPNAP